MKIVGVRLFFYQSIGIEENNTFQLKLFTLHKNCGRHRFGRLKIVGVTGELWASQVFAVCGPLGVANFFWVNR